MPFQPVPITAEAVLTYRYDGSDRDYQTVLHFTIDGGWDAVTIQDLADSLSGGAGPMDGFVPLTAGLVRVNTRDLSEEFGVQGVNNDDRPGTEDTLAWLPPNCSVPILLTCESGSPPRHGYVFWPFVREADCDRVGTLSGDALLVPAAYEDWMEIVEGAISTCIHVVVSRYERKDPPPGSVLRAAGIPNPVATYTIGRDGFVASQRDRRAGPA